VKAQLVCDLGEGLLLGEGHPWDTIEATLFCSSRTVDRRLKPDTVLEDSRAFFSDGLVTAGSSNAAAYVAGVVAVLRAAQPGLSKGKGKGERKKEGKRERGK